MKNKNQTIAVLAFNIILAALLLLTGCSSPAIPSSRIVFSSYAAGNADLYVIDSDGSNLKNLTNSPENETFLYSSPSDDRIIYRMINDKDNEEYWMITSDGTNASRLTETEEVYHDFTWSGDGRYCACIERNTNGLYIVGPATGKFELFMEHKDQITSLSWSPDDSRIAFLHRLDRSSRYDLSYMDVKTGDITKLIEFSNASPTSFSWAPDGKRIACTSYADNLTERTTDIYVVNIENGSRARITNDMDDNNDPIWSPDGKQIAFLTYTDYDRNIQMIGIDDTSVKTIYTSTGAFHNLVWLPEGDKISFRVASPDDWYGGTMYAFDIAKSEIVDEIDYLELTWNHDCSQAVFTDRSSQNVHVFSVDDHSIRQITDNTTGRCFIPRWSQ